MADPASDVHEVSARVLAEVSNVRLFEPAYAWDPIPTLRGEEQLVEGHSVFVTLDFVGNRTAVEGNVTVAGLVHCETRGGVNTTDYHVLGLRVPVPYRVDHLRAECVVAGTVIVTPTVYCQVQGDWDCDAPSAATMVPTGVRVPFASPDGQWGEVVEYAFSVTPPGESAPRTFYAFEVPVLRPWIHEDDGLERNLWAPLPLARLEAMDAWDFKFLHADRVDKV